MAEVRLRLYVTGRSARSEAAIANLERLRDRALPPGCEVQIVDVLEQPEVAERERVLVTPTLDRVLPRPLRRIIGDLSDADAVARGLGLAGPDRADPA